MQTYRRTRCAVATVAVAVALAGCGGGSGRSSSVPTLTGDCAAFQPYAGHAGTTVTVSGSIISPDSDALQKSWADFSRCTGITISYQGSDDFASRLTARVQGGTAPDLAVIAQPGLLARMVATHKVVKPPRQTGDNVTRYWSRSWKAYGTVGGTFYAAPMSATMKSLVWYSPKAFADAGYQPPKTWADLMSLSAKIAASGKGRPWCGGLGSGTATGSAATDWLEEVVLGKYGGDVYDRWVGHKVKFADPRILAAMELVHNWMQKPGWVNGGFGDVRTIATTPVQDAGKPILTGQCWMLQQPSSGGTQWPSGSRIGPDGTVYAFYLPPCNPSVRTPVEGGGDFVAAFSARPEVQAVQNYLSTPAWATSRIKVGTGWVSANTGVDKSAYTNPLDRLSAGYLTDPDATFRFDASDLMPAAVGAVQEPKSFTAWFGAGRSTEQVAEDVDGAWPG